MIRFACWLRTQIPGSNHGHAGPVCMYACVCMYVCACMYVCRYVRTNDFTYVYIYIYMYVRTYVCMYVCVYMYVRKYVYFCLLSMLHYSGVILHAVIIHVIGSVSFIGDAVTSLSLGFPFTI